MLRSRSRVIDTSDVERFFALYDDPAFASDPDALAARYLATPSPGLVEFTTKALFRDLWLRPGLAPRDRSLITVSSLVANGQTGQVGYHLGRAMDNGLSQTEAAEMITQLAFYAGWPNVFSALPVAKDVFAKRAAN